MKSVVWGFCGGSGFFFHSEGTPACARSDVRTFDRHLRVPNVKSSYFSAPNSIFEKGLVFHGKPEVCGERTGRRGILPGESSTDIDQVISDHAQTDPSLHSVSFVTASTQSVPTFEYADSSFATGFPLLSFAEPAFLLISAPFRAPGGAIGQKLSFWGPCWVGSVPPSLTSKRSVSNSVFPTFSKL